MTAAKSWFAAYSVGQAADANYSGDCWPYEGLLRLSQHHTAAMQPVKEKRIYSAAPLIEQGPALVLFLSLV